MTKSKIRVLVVGERDEDFLDWLYTILDEKFVVKKLHVLPDPLNPPSLLARWLTVIRKWKEALRKFKPDKVIIYGEEMISIWLIALWIKLSNLKIEIIVFRYDIENFRPYSENLRIVVGHYIAKKLEKFLLLSADKIIHKGLENELEFLPFYNQIRKKPHYLFREFLKAKFVCKFSLNKLSKKDGEFHLVFPGRLNPENLPYADSIWEFYPQLTNQKIHLHLYSRVDRKMEKKLREVESKNPYFHYEGYASHQSLIKELSKYDYGIALHGHNRAGLKKDYYSMTALGNKYFDYISAKLPILVVNDYLPIVKIIDKYGIGLYFDYKKLKSLKRMLIQNKKNYPKMVKNIETTIPQLLDHKKFLNFIES